MTLSCSLLKTKIERVVEMTFRKTRHALFSTIEGFYLADAWFENGEPRMQFRSSAHSLEEAATVAAAIHMAIDWVTEETAKGWNVAGQRETK